jgi:hypothetical protein
MTYISKFRGAGGRVVACYTCPSCGEVEREVERDSNGEAPDTIVCNEYLDTNGVIEARYGFAPHCDQYAVWTPTPIPGRVRRIEVSRGGCQNQERSTYLDTRELGEGQSMEEFQKKRKAVWDEKRKRDVMDIKKGFY